MKFFHLADLHIGKQVNGFSMLEDQRYILEQILDTAGQEAPDAIVIAGDIYDKPIPATEAVQLFDWFLTDLMKREIPVLAVSGNHDSPERIGFGDRIMEQQGIYLYGRFDGECRCITLEDKSGPVHFYLLPFLKPSYVKKYYPENGIDSYHDAVSTVLEAEKINTEERNVLVAHQFVVGTGQEPERSDSEVMAVGGIDSVNVSCMQEFDYTALGHLHRAQRIGRDEVRYAGSPLKYSASEHVQKKSMTQVTLGVKGEIQFEMIPLTPLRDMRLIRGPLERITSEEVVRGGDREDYVHVTLTDEGEVLDAIGKVRSVYPNVMTLGFDNQRSQTSLELQTVEGIQMMSPMEMFQAFYQEQNGAEMGEAQADIMKEIWKDNGGTL